MTEENGQPRKGGGAPTRDYIVLEQTVYEESEAGITYCWLEAHRVEARNSTNALRKAFKEMREERRVQGIEPLDEATLEVVPASYWKPTPVRAKKRESITVAVGA